MNLYLGPEFIINYRVSWVMTVVYVTMFYGLGMPLLFPIAFFSLLLIYSFERYHLAYTYQKPPVMNHETIKIGLSFIHFTPLILLMNGFWMLSNR